MNKSIQLGKLLMGVCYYPEHWDESLWADDLKRMKETGISMVRIAEFAWNKFEPEEGVFTFEFFDRFLALAQEYGIRIILGTPTATPPAWASHNYPEILNGSRDGVLFRHGSRRHYNYNSPKYRELTRILVTKLAQHYGQHPAVAGWQIDNELNNGVDEFYSASDSDAFRVFLRKKYGTLDGLNRAWGTEFWNQTYNAWEQVFVPRPTPTGAVNPHQQLDYLRFISDSACSFGKLQSDILRSLISKEQFITSNGMFENLDNHRMTEEFLDFYSYDSYPNFALALVEDPLHSDDLNDRKWSRKLSESRSISENFAIMEQQAGANGWYDRYEAPSPKPGQLTLWTMQSVAHGADYISYFRWRTCTMGTESYWHGILDYCGRPNRRLREVQEVSKKFDLLQDIAGAKYRASFAYLQDYDNKWDAKVDRWHSRVDKVSQKGWFNASQLTHTPMDYLYLREGTMLEELQKYPLLVYPHAVIMTRERAELLRAYVEAGGILVLGCRTGYKDLTGQCVQLPMPGRLRELSGADVTDFTLIGPADGPVNIDWGGEKIPAAVFNDILEPLDGAEVLGTFDASYYQGCAGLLRKKLGKGSVYYFGAAFTQETAAAFLKKLGMAESFSEYLDAPPECELALREKDGKKWLFVLNYQNSPVALRLKSSLKEVFSQEEKSGEIEMKPFETMVFLLP